MKKFWKWICFGVLFCILLTGCAANNTSSSVTSQASEQQEAKEENMPAEENETGADNSGEAAKETAAQKAEELLKTMTLEEKVYQMFMVRPEDLTGIGIAVQAGEATKEAIEKYPVGGIIYFSQNVESREQLKEMIENTQSYAKYPLWIGVDEEGGRVARLGSMDIGVATHPPMGEVGTRGNPEEAREIGAALAEDLQALGFNLDFAPVADVLTVENNQDIGDRSFGRDPALVSQMVAAEVEGLQNGGISATLKHFPSNGSTSANTHHGYGESDRTLEEMRETEFLPFRAGIDADVDLVMVAHMAAVQVTGEKTPSTLSKMMVTDLLRGELGFQKVIVSDALNMGAITESYTPGEAAMQAIEAGIDLLLMSPDFPSAAAEILQKIDEGVLTEERIDESVLRILTLKYERGVIS